MRRRESIGRACHHPRFFLRTLAVVGVKAWTEAWGAELARAKSMVGCWGKKGAGYEQRWPTDWRTYLKAKLNKTIVCVTELMDHVVAENIKVHAGTPRASDVRIFHGGLSAWWEALAQEHMASLGMANRQIRNITANVGTRYEFKILGDSPEICRGLDSHGFADLKAAVTTYASAPPFTPARTTRGASTSARPRRCSAVSNARGPWRRRASASAGTS
jgi:hypothetical protein